MRCLTLIAIFCSMSLASACTDDASDDGRDAGAGQVEDDGAEDDNSEDDTSEDDSSDDGPSSDDVDDADADDAAPDDEDSDDTEDDNDDDSTSPDDDEAVDASLPVADDDAPDSGASEPPVVVPVGTVPCDTDKTCVPFGMVCDLERSVCVNCAGYEDCAEYQRCEFGSCVAVEICESSKDCTNPDHVCVSNTLWGGMCLQCAMPADCDDGEMCVSNICVQTCASDKDCTDPNEICRINPGFCNECHDNIGCAADEYCDGWKCMPQVCEPGSSICLGQAVVTCNELGSGYGVPSGCGDYTCIEDNGVALCDVQ